MNEKNRCMKSIENKRQNKKNATGNSNVLHHKMQNQNVH